MDRYDLYDSINKRTDGDIYVGVVGPVRTGKSTFIKKFMDVMVLPVIENENWKTRITDELPQSGSGKTIMTTQPKFVPDDAITINIDDSATLNVRMVDCVGYIVDGALGHIENDMPRMVRTPWFDYDIPFEEAAEIGTRKVIKDHSTIGVVVTTDGSITGIPRGNYIEAEERVIKELKELNKPFVVLLNTESPNSEETERLKSAISDKYDVPVLAFDVMHMDREDINTLMEKVLFEFPLKQITFNVPLWVQALSEDHWLPSELVSALVEKSVDINKVRDYKNLLNIYDENEHVTNVTVNSVQLGTGQVEIDVALQPELFYKVLGDECGYEIKNDFHLTSIIKELVAAKTEYDKVADAIKSVKETGYGVVSPLLSELTLEEPEIVRQGNRFGVKLKASAPSLHMIRVDIKTEVNPIVGTEQQSEELVKYLLSEFESDPSQIWATDIFGKSLHELVNEGLANKLTRMPDDAREKVQETLQRIINEGNGGLICILL